MIKKKDLADSILKIRRRWEPGSGVFVVFQDSKGRDIRLVVDCLLNPGLAVENCRVWKGADNLYSGPVDIHAVAACFKGFTASTATTYFIPPRSKTTRKVQTWKLGASHDKQPAVCST